MIITITASRGVVAQLPATLTRRASIDGSHGSAELLIPRTSPINDIEVIDPDGGFLVEFPLRNRVWRGVAETPRYLPEGVRVRVLSVTAWLDTRRVRGGRLFYGVPAAVVIRTAFRETLSSRAHIPLRLGSLLTAPPLVGPGFNYSGSLLEILNRLSAWTGHEWEIDQSLRLNWMTHTGRFHEFVIVDDGRFLSAGLGQRALQDRFSDVTEIDPFGRRLSQPDYSTPGLWPAEREEQG